MFLEETTNQLEPSSIPCLPKAIKATEVAIKATKVSIKATKVVIKATEVTIKATEVAIKATKVGGGGFCPAFLWLGLLTFILLVPQSVFGMKSQQGSNGPVSNPLLERMQADAAASFSNMKDRKGFFNYI